MKSNRALAPVEPLRRLLLVWPEIPSGTFWSFDHALSLVGRQANVPPLGLLTVAALLPPDFEVRLIDLAVDALTDEAIAWADAVFLSGMLVQRAGIEDVAARAGRLGVPVVAGGPYASTGYRDLPDVDHFVIGEAEDTLAHFLRDWVRGEARRAYARPAEAEEVAELRAWFGEDADVALAEARPALKDTPVPRFDLLELRAYQSMAVQFSRGCPVGCEFCDIWTRFGRRSRTKPARSILAELDALLALGWRGPVFVVDDNLIGNPGRARALLQEMVAWQHEHGHPFTFLTEATLLLAELPELLALMREAGFDMVFVGIESPAQESLVETGKKVNRVHRMGRQVETIQAAGIQVSSGFIIGFDSDPADIAPRMIRFVGELGVPLAMVGLLTALPATQLQRRLQAEGRMLEGSSGNNTHQFSLNFRPLIPEAEVTGRYKEVLRALYPPSMGSFFQRAAAFRERWTPNPWARRSAGRREIWGAISSLWVIGLTRHGPRYLQFLLGTLLRKPSFFPTAVRLGIQGHHLREVTRTVFELDALDALLAELRALLTDADASTVGLRGDARQLLRTIRRRIVALPSREQASREDHYRALLGELDAFFGERTGNLSEAGDAAG